MRRAKKVKRSVSGVYMNEKRQDDALRFLSSGCGDQMVVTAKATK